MWGMGRAVDSVRETWMHDDYSDALAWHTVGM